MVQRRDHKTKEALHEPPGSGAGVPPAAGASRPRIRRGRDARDDSRDGCPTIAPSLFMVPTRVKYGVGALQEPERQTPVWRRAGNPSAAIGNRRLWRSAAPADG